MNKTLQILHDRGFIKACTDSDALSDLMDKEPVTFYVGVDPSGRSIHIGHMVPFFAMHHMQEAGHNPIALVGGGTGMIGDPSGKTELRKMLTHEQIAANSASIKKQLGTVIDFAEMPPNGLGRAQMVNNADWLLGLNYIDFLREIGSQFSVNRMLTFESYKQRLERGLSFIEFNYQLLQSYDFLTLYRTHGCRLQMGGDDQWGNIVAGIDLIRRMESAECYGLTFNLIMRADGKKMGKSEKGAVFLDPDMYSPYDFYQYWRNVNDADVFKFMKLFTFLPLEEIDDYAKPGVNINEVKERLAWEQTRIIHGQEEADKARDAAKAAFGSTGANPAAREGMPSMEIPADRLASGIPALELFVESKLVPSNSDGRRLIAGGGAHVNETKIESHDQVIDSSWRDEQGELILRSGKKKFFRIIVK
ncbi:tyrosine--tRNA ligase [Parasphaerochaeta coccoides]|uniref:Tyrosine--tRNA ligase n=1 Tax=Parasphaerochaeta coccoides (strain ATCC BAA-1237 / DSM 17374 / SPN1) TaxID=760011 RepID=F4GJD9_PARC1|nr:tyrosine--tRNA ligase [Parasphaerochaeta coccoides]AEC02204.1 tyrosyl-tRNA synthetase [Parasphaerochaeta coccoides DSM 17374]